MQNIIVLGDITTALVAAGWSQSFGIGKIGENAMKAFAISVLARVASQNSGMIPLVDADQKSQLIVFALGVLNGYMYKGNPVRYGLTQSAQDLLGDELAKLLRQDPNYSIYSMGATSKPAGQI
jgi:hypothetical protein